MQTKISHAEEAVRARAYQFWIEEGRPEGRHDVHWHRAIASLTPLTLVPETVAVVSATDVGVSKAKATKARAAKPRSK